jgi:pyrimidine operon attenuation protein/uracil phosphoribosyltransferase
LNSGKVLMYGTRHLLTKRVKQLTTAVLVDRNHKRYPIKADVKGLSLSTSLTEHVEVAINGNQAEVYLF